MTLTQALARHIIEVLGSSGTPPSKGIKYFNVGNLSLLNALDDFYLSSYLQQGGATYKMVVGDYGSGKSHFLYCLRDRAWERGFAVVKVDLSPVETPYNDQRLVYQAVAQNIYRHEADDEIFTQKGLTHFLKGSLLRLVGEDLTLHTLTNEEYRTLVKRIKSGKVDSSAYKAAILGYLEALIRPEEERLDGLARWLLGESTSPDDTKLLRQMGVTGKITPSNAFRMLRSLAQIVRLLSYHGLILLFDEVDRMSSIGGQAERLATDNLREVIDRCRDELPGTMFVYAVPPQFIHEIVPRYPALQQRIRTPGRFSRLNHFSPLISLERLDLAEDELMLSIGEKLIPIYESAFDMELDHNIQFGNAAILANVARDIYLDVSHRRLFVKSFVTELSRQHLTHQYLITEEEAIAIIRGQLDELSEGETRPF